MKSFIVKNTWSKRNEHVGWGNGYVVIPPTSSWHGVEYNNIPVHAYKGLTYSDKAEEFRISDIEIPDCIDDNDWVIGFDTAHAFDGHMTKKDVERETYKLLGAMEQLGDTPYQKDLITQVRCPNCHLLNNVSHLVEDLALTETRLWSCDDCGNFFYFSI